MYILIYTHVYIPCMCKYVGHYVYRAKEWFCVIKVFFYSAIVLRIKPLYKIFSSVSIANINSLMEMEGKEALVSFDSQ